MILCQNEYWMITGSMIHPPALIPPCQSIRRCLRARSSQPFAHVHSSPSGCGLMMCVMCRRPTIGPPAATEVVLCFQRVYLLYGFIVRQPSPKLRLKLTCASDQMACQSLACVCLKVVKVCWSDSISVMSFFLLSCPRSPAVRALSSCTFSQKWWNKHVKY